MLYISHVLGDKVYSSIEKKSMADAQADKVDNDDDNVTGFDPEKERRRMEGYRILLSTVEKIYRA